MPIITDTPIPPGSFSIRVFEDGKTPEEDDIDTVLILRNEGNGVCKAALGHGDLYNELNEQIGLRAFALGFRIFKFQARLGVKVSRYAELIRSDSKFNYWQVDLVKAIAEYEAGNS